MLVILMAAAVVAAATANFDDLTSYANQNDFPELNSLIDSYLTDIKLAQKAELHLRNQFS